MKWMLAKFPDPCFLIVDFSSFSTNICGINCIHGSCCDSPKSLTKLKNLNLSTVSFLLMAWIIYMQKYLPVTTFLTSLDMKVFICELG